jgi:hypothetical protein
VWGKNILEEGYQLRDVKTSFEHFKGMKWLAVALPLHA